MLPHVVGRGVIWWGGPSPQKSSCDSSSEGGSASCRHEKRQEELPRARRGHGRDSLEFPSFFLFPRWSRSYEQSWLTDDADGLARLCPFRCTVLWRETRLRS